VSSKKKQCLVISLVLSIGIIMAQRPYFQQEVNITMSVTLNDSTHTLRGFEQIEYINLSPDTIGYIYIHLWPNAYKDRNTALGRQLYRMGKRDFWLAKEADRGYIDSLGFKADGKPVNFELNEDFIDICRIRLPHILSAGESVLITTPFFVKIPSARFSRFGHIGQAYYVTQWFPKPAVYDSRGWHAMPYLDQGEFYSEFGKFDVSITLPENYVLAATGDRMDATEELKFIENKIEETEARALKEDYRKKEMNFPPSSRKMKTVRFVQRNVHDFAWFADKRYNVMRRTAALRNGRTIQCYAYFTNSKFNLWKNAAGYVSDAIRFYSDKVGEYPYEHATAVDGTIMAGGGMEYPNITVIGDLSDARELDMTIAHEVGHNWFYGMLGNNEREHPFLDEGINSFYEAGYARFKYPRMKISEYLGKDSSFRFMRLNRFPVWKMHELLYFFAARRNTDQTLNLSSDDYTELNYGAVVYGKPVLIMDYIRDYLGERMFDTAMHRYFREFRFRHPYPEDLFATLSRESGRNTFPFYQYLVNANDKMDYKISGLTKSGGVYKVRISNNTEVPLPYSLSAIKNGSVLETKWSEGMKGVESMTMTGEAGEFKIDANEQMPDLYPGNNSMRTKGIFRKVKPLQFTFVTTLYDPGRTQLSYLPVIGANAYDGVLGGISIHNYNIYRRKVEFNLTPMFGFKTLSPAGFAGIARNWYPKSNFTYFTAGINAKSFGYDKYEHVPYNDANGLHSETRYLSYLRLAPYIEAELKQSEPNRQGRQLISLTSIQLFTDSMVQSGAGSLARQQVRNRYSYINQLNYVFSGKPEILPLRVHMNLQQAGDMSKISATLNYTQRVGRNNDLLIRVFAGSFLSGSENARRYYAFRASGYNGYQDYAFSGIFAGRNERQGPGFWQFMDVDGAMKLWTPYGQSTGWLAALNVRSPGLLGFRVFGDVATCDPRFLPKSDPFLWDAGISFTFIRDIADVYLPLLYCRSLRESLDVNGISTLNRIRFTFNIHKVSPSRIIQDISR
jgi:hypothetical protein